MTHALLHKWDAAAQVRLFDRNVIIWEGPSELTGDPIFVIASGKTSNRKIGAMVQLWILTDEDPIAAVQSGRDRAVCGDCQHRGDGDGHARSCYVEYWRAPENIHQFKHRAARRTPEEFSQDVRGMQIRIGAYGDPVAVPHDVWAALLLTAGGWTAYTHQWRTAPAPFRGWCMASVDTPREKLEAERLGWRTFRVRTSPGVPVLSDEVVCPASLEGGQRAVCADCSLCRGASRQAKSVVIVAHGSNAKWFGARQPVADKMAPRLVHRT